MARNTHTPCQLRFPSHFSKELRDLCKQLIQPDVTQRFGTLVGGIRDITVVFPSDVATENLPTRLI